MCVTVATYSVCVQVSEERSAHTFTPPVCVCPCVGVCSCNAWNQCLRNKLTCMCMHAGVHVYFCCLCMPFSFCGCAWVLGFWRERHIKNKIVYVGERFGPYLQYWRKEQVYATTESKSKKKWMMLWWNISSKTLLRWFKGVLSLRSILVNKSA